MGAWKIHQTVTAAVFAGSFNPRIFEPSWLSNHGLVPKPEADAAEVQLVDRDFCRIALGWTTLVVTDERLQVESTSETVNDGQIRDLLVGIFRLLPHSPVSQGSIHHGSHIAIDTEDHWHRVGHTLAPKEVWEGVLDDPGMFDFAMMGKRPDDLQGAIKIRIQPSGLVQPGVFMNVNDEFVLEEGRDESPIVADLLETLWPAAESRASDIREELLSRLLS